MKTLLFIALCIFPNIIFGQKTIKGNLIDSHSKAPISYGTLLVKSIEKGIVTDFHGHYNLALPDTTPNNTTVIVASLGYESKQMKLSRCMATDTIDLDPITYAIPEVVVTNKKFKLHKIGPGVLANRTARYRVLGQINLQAVLYIPNPDNIEGWLSSVKFHIAKRGIPNAPFRLRILEKTDTSSGPGKDLLLESVVLRGKEGWVSFNVDTLNIKFPRNGFFVGFEWLNENSQYRYTETWKNETTINYGHCISITDAIPEHRTWMRNLLFNQWQLRDWWYSDRKKTKPNNIMVGIVVKTYKN